MMHKIFVDANVVIDWLNADSERNAESTACLEIISTLYHKPYISPVTFCIVYYLVSKKIKSKKHVHAVLKQAFEQFSFSIENERTVTDAMDSDFTDWEDALQYFSSQTIKADAIVTYNLRDFPGVDIPVMHPGEFVQLHNIKS